MTPQKKANPNEAERLAARLSEMLVEARIVPRFVDSYVVEHGRHALQVHAPLYRDLLTLLQREALLAAAVRLLELACLETISAGKGKQRTVQKPGATSFRRKFLASLTKHQKWTAGDALEFQSDLQMYEELLARASGPRRSPKPFEAANHPFVDRCAFVLDSSFMAEARLAASRTLAGIEELARGVLENSARSNRTGRS